MRSFRNRITPFNPTGLVLPVISASLSCLVLSEKVTIAVCGLGNVGKVDVDEETDIARRYGIMSIPTLIVFKNGKVVEQAVGARGKQDIAEMLERHL